MNDETSAEPLSSRRQAHLSSMAEPYSGSVTLSRTFFLVDILPPCSRAFERSAAKTRNDPRRAPLPEFIGCHG